MKTPWFNYVFSYSLSLLVLTSSNAAASSTSFEYKFWQMSSGDVKNYPEIKCEDVESPYTAELNFVSKYAGGGPEKDEINKKALRIYTESVSTIRSFEKVTVKNANKYLLTGNPSYRDCVVRWVNAWARKEALLDTKANRTGKFVRKWALGSISLAVLQITQDGVGLGDSVAEWIDKLSSQVIDDFDQRSDKRHNNHDYWAAWSVFLSSLYLKDKAKYNWAINEWEFAISNIDSGYLPRELKRETRALEYHNYALQPLYFIADFACELGNKDLINQPQLHKLIDRVAQGMVKKSVFKKKTEHKQNTSKLYSQGNMAWWARYKTRFDKYPRSIKKYVKDARYSTRLGGDLMLLEKPSDCS